MRVIVYCIVMITAALLVPVAARAQANLGGTTTAPSASGWRPERDPFRGQLGSGPFWLRGEVPPQSANDPTPRGNATAGARLLPGHCESGWCQGLDWALMPHARIIADAPRAGGGTTPQLGLSLLQELGLRLAEGLRLTASLGVGERPALFAPLRASGSAPLAGRAQAGISAELSKLGGPPMRVAVSVAAVRPLLTEPGPPITGDASLRVEVGAEGGAPFVITLPFGPHSRLGFGLRAKF